MRAWLGFTIALGCTCIVFTVCLDGSLGWRDFEHVLPPLPLFTELSAVLAFALDSIDDAIEDVTKIGCVYTLGWTPASIVSQHMEAPPAVGAALGVAGSMLMYRPCDSLGDWVGDVAEHGQRWMGLHRGTIEKEDVDHPRAGDMAKLLDDMVEDSMKSACMWIHWTWGNMVASHLARQLLDRNHGMPSAFTRHVYTVMGKFASLAAPAASYDACNDYADQLGDLAQSASLRLVYGHDVIEAEQVGSQDNPLISAP